VQELASGTPTANLLTGLDLDEFFTRTDGAGVRNYLTDALGSSVALLDGSGTVQTEYTYEPFGATTVTGASTTSAFGFTGRENDGTGLLYYRARYYHPATQRFVSEDPLGAFGGDSNLYTYALNSPADLTDPTGESPWLLVPLGGCIGGAIGMGSAYGWSGRKIALGCTLGAFVGLGVVIAPYIGPAAAAGAGAAAAAAARAGTHARATAQATGQAFGRAAAATGRAARAATQAATRMAERAGNSARETYQRARDYASTHPADITKFLNDVMEGAGPDPTVPNTPGKFIGWLMSLFK
jgi:RHS repeat-associated protein